MLIFDSRRGRFGQDKPKQYGSTSTVRSSVFRNAERLGIDPANVKIICPFWERAGLSFHNYGNADHPTTDTSAAWSAPWDINNALSVYDNGSYTQNDRLYWLADYQTFGNNWTFFINTTLEQIVYNRANLLDFGRSTQYVRFHEDNTFEVKFYYGSSHGAYVPNIPYSFNENFSLAIVHDSTNNELSAYKGLTKYAETKNGQGIEAYNNSGTNDIHIGRGASYENYYGWEGPVYYFYAINSALSYDTIAQIQNAPYLLLHPTPQPLFFDVAGGGTTLSAATAWSIYATAQQASAWRILTSAAQSTAWSIYTADNQAAAWRVKTADSQTSTWKIKAASNQASAWSIYTTDNQAAAWSIRTADNQQTSYAIRTADNADIAWRIESILARSSAWRIRNANSLSSSWKVYGTESQDTAWKILTAGAQSIDLAWKIRNADSTGAAWKILTTSSTDSAWKIANAQAIDSAWQIITATSTSTAWSIQTQAQIDTAWKIINAGAAALSTAWKIYATDQTSTEWMIRAATSTDTSWSVYNLTDTDLSWRLRAQASASTEWMILTSEQLQTAWALNSELIPEPIKTFYAPNRTVLFNAQTRTVVFLADKL